MAGVAGLLLGIVLLYRNSNGGSPAPAGSSNQQHLSAPAGNSNQHLGAPAGYTNQQLIFDDQFSGTRLDTAKWTTLMGANGVVWNNQGTLPAGYTGQNSGSGQNGGAVLNASQLTVDNGLTITAQQNTTGVQEGNYPWIGGVINTMGKFTLPSTGWYVQAKIRWPDTTVGMWPSLWFMPPGSGPSNELDGFEGGFENPGLGPQNQLIHYDYFSPSGSMQHMANVGVDMSAGHHVYGVEYIPNVSIKYYFDGVLEATTSGVPIPAESYEIMINLMVAVGEHVGVAHGPDPWQLPRDHDGGRRGAGLYPLARVAEWAQAPLNERGGDAFARTRPPWRRSWLCRRWRNAPVPVDAGTAAGERSSVSICLSRTEANVNGSIKDIEAAGPLCTQSRSGRPSEL